VLTASHPSPLAGKGFEGCHHFSQTNTYLLQQNKGVIDWTITDE